MKHLGAKIFYTVSTAIVFLLLFIYFFHPVANLVGDLGYYLKIGQVIFQTKSVPTTNLFSYTYPQFPFINDNWLSEVLFYLIELNFGFNGLILLSVLLGITAFSFIFITAAKKIDIFASALIGFIYVQILYERTDIKPELFSFLLLSLFITILYKYRDKYTTWIFILIPLELLWVNLHIYYFLGIVVLLFFLIDAFISQKEKHGSKKTLTLLAVTIGTTIATLINPHFLQGAAYPLFVLNNYAFPVEENINFLTAITSYTDTTFLYFGIATAILWIGILMSIKKLRPVDILLAAFFTCMGFSFVRAFPLFVFGTFIPCVVVFSHMLTLIYKKMSTKKTLLLKIGLFTGVCILSISTITLNIQIHGFGLGVTDNAKGAINFMKENNIQGPIYNDFDIGNYLDYQLYPQQQVFVDNRAEAYPKDFFQNIYFPMQDSPIKFAEESKEYNFNVIVFADTDTSPDTAEFLQNLGNNSNWKMVYLNSAVVIFLKNSSGNQAIIHSHLITANNVTLSKSDLDDKNNVRLLSNFFREIGWEKSWLTMSLRYLDFDPTNCAALENVAYLYQKENSPYATIYINKFVQTCRQ